MRSNCVQTAFCYTVLDRVQTALKLRSATSKDLPGSAAQGTSQGEYEIDRELQGLHCDAHRHAKALASRVDSRETTDSEINSRL